MPWLDADSLTDSLIKNLQEAIWRGQYMPGDHLPSHRQLAEQYGIGLSTVREAIKGLATIGLVDVRSGRGTRVLPNAAKVLRNMASVNAGLDRVEFSQAYEARVTIEVALARLAAERATPADQQRIRQALDEMKEQIEDTEAYRRADWRFHLLVAEAARNPILAQMYQLASELLRQMLQLTLSQPGGKERGIHYQEELLQAIAARDPERAANSAQEHMAAFRADWLAAVGVAAPDAAAPGRARRPLPEPENGREEVVIATGQS